MIKIENEIVLIGGLGYVGSAIADYFNAKEINVSIIDNNIYEKKIEMANQNQFIDIDIRNFEDISKIDYSSKNIIVLAGLVGDPITSKYPKESNLINDYSLIRFLSNLKNYRRLIFISTCSNYGLNSSNKQLDEQSKLNPISLYSKAKVKVEKYLISSGKNFTILRFATAFGHSGNMRFDLTLNEFTAYQYFNKFIEVYDFNTYRPYCHVNDFANVIDKVITTKNEDINKQIFNVGSNQNNISKKDLISMISKITGNNNYELIDNSKDKRNDVVDFSKVHDYLGFETQYSIQQGIEEIVKHLEQNTYGLNEDFEKVSNYYGNYFIPEKKLFL